MLASTSILGIYQVIFVLFATGLFIASLEYLKATSMFASNGILSWNITQNRWGKKFQHGWLGHCFKQLFSETGVKSLLYARIVKIVLLLYFPMGSLIWFSIALALVFNIALYNLIAFYGSDGSDQMTSIILITITLCLVPFGNELLLKAGLWFIALQSCLSYFAAGIAKLLSPQWRGGTAVTGIFNSRTYGTEWVANYLKDKPQLGVFLCWSVIIIEILFPLCLLLPLPLCLVMLTWGFVFHLLNAVIMGLNSFLWAFIATYPAILFVNSEITGFLIGI